MLPEGPQKVFLIVTFIIIVTIVLLSESLSDALLIISLLSQFLIISTLMSSVSERHDKAANASISMPWYPTSDFTEGREEFASKPVVMPGTGISFDATKGSEMYPGGLEHLPDAAYDFGAAGPAGMGAVYSPVNDWSQGLDGTGADGPPVAPTDPFMLNRIESRAGPAPCDTGYASEAYNSFDADRQMVEHGRWRNDPYRVSAGIQRRKAHVQKYVEEELQEKENEPWWGRWDL